MNFSRYKYKMCGKFWMMKNGDVCCKTCFVCINSEWIGIHLYLCTLFIILKRFHLLLAIYKTIKFEQTGNIIPKKYHLNIFRSPKFDQNFQSKKEILVFKLSIWFKGNSNATDMWSNVIVIFLKLQYKFYIFYINIKEKYIWGRETKGKSRFL